MGFQITFFRTRPELKEENPSAFTPRQILIAHAAISDPVTGRLQHDQHMAREGFALARRGTRSGLKYGLTTGPLKAKAVTTKVRSGTHSRSRFPVGFHLAAIQGPMLQGSKGSAARDRARSPRAITTVCRS